MNYNLDMQIIELDSFMTAFPVRPDEEDAARRRFMTLLGEAEPHAKAGGTSYVMRAWTLDGLPLALKRSLHARRPMRRLRTLSCQDWPSIRPNARACASCLPGCGIFWGKTDGVKLTRKRAPSK